MLGTVTLLEGVPKPGFWCPVYLGGFSGGWLCALCSSSPSVPLSSLEKQARGRGDIRGPCRDKQGHGVGAGKVARTRSLNLN